VREDEPRVRHPSPMVQEDQPAAMEIDEKDEGLGSVSGPSINISTSDSGSYCENESSVCFKEWRRWDKNEYCRVVINQTLKDSENQQKLNMALQRELEGDSRFETVHMLLNQGADPNY